MIPTTPRTGSPARRSVDARALPSTQPGPTTGLIQATRRKEVAIADSLAAAINRVFAEWDRPDSPGCAVGISRGDTVLYEHGYGTANLETATAISAGTVFQAGSVSKQFTAFAILLLARDGKLLLDDPVRRHIPEWPENARAITLRHLLTHTSGLREVSELFWLATGDPNVIYTEEAAVEMIGRQRQLNFPPGTQSWYSNAGYGVLAAVVARVSGEPFSVFTQNRIFTPLGMIHTRFQADAQTLIKDRASGYDRGAADSWIRWIGEGVTPGASGLWTTVGDLLTWQSNFERPRIGDETMLKLMQMNTVLPSGDSTGVGLGLDLGSYRGARTLGHPGSDIGFKADLVRFPDLRASIAVLCNAWTARPAAPALQIADAFLSTSLLPEPSASSSRPAETRPVVAAPDLRRYAGVFENSEANEVMWIRARNEQLFVALASAAGPRAARFPLRIVGEGQFSPPSGEVLSFTIGDTNHFVRTSGTTKTAFERRAEVALRRDQLSEYTGEYYSNELRTLYSVTARDSTLQFRPLSGVSFALAPSFRDAFDGRVDPTNINVKFQRDPRRRIVGFTLSTLRARQIRFTKRTGR